MVISLAIKYESLATYSNYFQNLFFGDWKERRADKSDNFEIQEVDNFGIEAFKLMLYSAMTMGWMVNELKIYGGIISNFLKIELIKN